MRKSSSLGTQRIMILAGLLAWTAATILGFTIRGSGLVLLALGPGWALFGIALAIPSPAVIAAKSLAGSLSLLLYFQAGNSIRRGDCSGDGLCPTKILYGAMAEPPLFLLFFGVLMALGVNQKFSNWHRRENIEG